MMKSTFFVFAVVIASSSMLSAEEARITQKNVDDFYVMCWRELEVTPPRLEIPTTKIIEAELKGTFTYEVFDEVSGLTKTGSITFRYPKWDWPDDGSKGSARQFGEKIVLLDESSDVRALLLRIEGRWQIMQMDFPGGLVKLKKSIENR